MQAFVEGISEAWLQTPCLVSGYNFDFDIGAFRAEANGCWAEIAQSNGPSR